VREDGSSRVFNLGDLRGASRVLFYDGLEESCRWVIAPNRFGASVSRSQGKVYCGDWSGKLIGGASVPNGYVSTYCWRDFPSPPGGEVTLRAVLGADYIGTMSRVALYVYKVTDGVLRVFGVGFEPTTGFPQLISSSGAWVNCSSNPVYLGGMGWHLFEVIVDWSLGVYRRILVNDIDFDVDGIAYQTYSPLPVTGRFGIRILQYMSGGGLTLYFDEVCVLV
jgi:hypothetical protein